MRVYPFRILLRIGFLLTLGAWAAGCTTNPATGKKSFTLYSWETEKRLGLDAAPQMTEQFGGEVPDEGVSAYVQGVGLRLAEGVEEGVPDLDWEFTLLNSPVINAFALPGGKIFISRGLAEKLGSEAELAGVLGHEIGHVTARHANQRMSAQVGFNIALVGTAIAVGAADEGSDVRRYGQVGVPALAVGGNLVLLRFGRDEELEADMLGMRYMARAGYTPEGQLRVMRVLRDASRGPRPIEFFSTHPHPESRIARIEELLAGEYAGAMEDPTLVVGAAVYERRLLRVLEALAPAPEPDQALLGTPSLWCAHCAPDGAGQSRSSTRRISSR